MQDFHTVSSAAEVLTDIFGNHHRPMLASGTAEGDGQIALAFVNIMRQQVDQQVGDAGNKFLRLRERANVFGDAGMAPSQRAKLGYEVRVGEKADIED